MRKTIMVIIVLVVLICCNNCIAASDSNCIDNVTSKDKLVLCGNKLIGDCDARLDAEIGRLKSKYKGNRGILILIDDTWRTWDSYRNVACVLDGAIAAHGEVVGELPVEAEKAKLRCNVKKYNDIITVLSTY